MAAAGLQNLLKSGRDGKNPSQTDFYGLEIMFWGVNGDSGGSEIVWFPALWQGTGVVFLKTFRARGVDDNGPSKTTF